MKQTIASVFAVSLLLSGVASAQTYYPTYSTGYSSGYAGTCPQIGSDLYVGSHGSDVSTLQNFLVSQNYPGSGSWMVTGYFGPATAAALRNYQSQHNLAVSGILDALTRAAIAACSSGYSYNAYQSTPSYTYPSYPSYPTYPTYPTYPNYPTYPYPGYQYGNRPYISSLSKTSGEEGDSVRIYGSGFSDEDNDVMFGSKRISNLDSSNNGREIRFTVPRDLSDYRDNAYRYTYPYNYGYNTFLVSVTNDDGYTSNAVPFTVTSIDEEDPEITDVDGPSSLRRGEVGTWRLRIDPNGVPYVTVSIDWDDDDSDDFRSQNFYGGSQTLSFSHAYHSTGTYRIEFRVRSASGGSDTVTQTVRVSSSSNDDDDTSISSISPTSGRVGTQITIRGEGFDSTDNTVHFGIGGTMHVPSYDDGERIYFTVPAYISQCDVMPGTNCFYAQPVTRGDYEIYVENDNGTTDSRTFRVTN